VSVLLQHVPRAEVRDYSEVNRPWVDTLPRLVPLKSGAWGELSRHMLEEYSHIGGSNKIIPFERVEYTGKFLYEKQSSIKHCEALLNDRHNEKYHSYSNNVDPHHSRGLYRRYHFHSSPARAELDAARTDPRWYADLYMYFRHWAFGLIVVTPFRRAALIDFWSVVLDYEKSQRRQLLSLPPQWAENDQPSRQQPHGHAYDEGTI
jgi:hypothetical protein